MNEELIKQLQEGKVAVKNNGSLDDLKKVLKYACPKDNWPISGTYSFYIVYNIEWKGVSRTNLPSYSVKEFLKEEFVLPEKYYIECLTKEHIKIVQDWWNTKYGKNRFDCTGEVKYYFPSNNSYGFYGYPTKSSNLPTITFEQFKKHILKEETMEKKIIGYKLIKPEYKDAAEKIAGINNWEVFEKKLNTVSWGYDARNSLQKAGVLDLWFEKVYEEEFKVGDWVIGWHTRNLNYHTTAWQINKINDEFIYPVENRCENTTSKSIRKATPEEIEEVSIKLPVINGYEGKVEGDFVIYGRDCAKFHKTFFVTLNNWFQTVFLGNRKAKSIQLDSGVEITMKQVEQIVKYLNAKGL